VKGGEGEEEVDGKHKMTGDTNECGYNCCASVCCVCFGSHNNKSIIHGEYFAELAAAWLGLHYDSLSVKHMAKKEDGQNQKKIIQQKKAYTTKQENKKRNRERFRKIRRKLASLEPFKPTLPPRENVWACANKQEIKPTLHSAHTYGYYKYTDHEIKNSTKREEEEEESNNIYYIKVDARCDFDMPNYGREIQKKRKEEENGKKKKKSTTFYFYYFYDYFFVCLKGEVYKALVVGSGRSVSWKLSEARKSCRTFCAVMRREAQADGFLPISFVLLDLSFPK
jgi:hypothetical protein